MPSSSISRHAKGGSKKDGRPKSVSPAAALSSEAAVKQLTVDQVRSAITEMLGVYTDDPSLKSSILQSALDGFAPSSQPVAPAVAALPPVAAAREPIATPDIIISAIPSNTLSYNPNAFSVKMQGGVLAPRKTGASTMRQAKSQHLKKFTAALASIPTAEQKLLVVHDFLKRNRNDAAVSEALPSVAFGMEGIDIVQNMRKIIALADSDNRKRFADSIGFKRTLLLALAPSNEPSSQAVRRLKKLLGATSRSFNSQFKRAVQARNSLFLSHNNKQPLLQRHTRTKKSVVTPELQAQVEHWMMNHCDEICASPNSNHTVMALDPETGLKERKQRYFYLTSLREVHNALLNSFPGARTADGKVIISDTMLRSMCPRWLSRMTDSHKEMCGCEPCIIVKQFMRTLVAWVCKFISSMNEEDPEDLEEMKQFLLKYDTVKGCLSPRYDHPRQIVAKMTCAPPDEHEGLFLMGCCLGRCENCPKLNIPTIMGRKEPTNDEEDEKTEEKKEDDDTVIEAPTISYQDYKYHSYCTLHHSLQGALTKCRFCDELEEGKGKLMRKKHLTRNRKTIGVFMEEVFVPQFQFYRYHLLHVILLGKNYCVRWRKDAYKEIPGSLLVQRDFADRLIAAFTDQIQSTHFGENASMGMEGLTTRWSPNNFHYHSFLADNSKQDSRTVHVNTISLIRILKAEYGLLPAGSWLFELMDGCAKQCRSGTALFLMTVVAVMFGIIVDRMIQAPQYGKGDCDSQGKIDKNYLRRYFRRTVVPEEASTKKGIEAHTVGEDGIRSSIAERLASILRCPSRDAGSKGDRKHVKRESSAKIQKRHYHVIHNGKIDITANVQLPLENTKFKATGFINKKNQRYNGMMAHYHFHADPNLGIGRIAARRIPCLCPPCFAQLQSSWEDDVPPEAQAKFASAPDCELRAVLQDNNEWHIITLVEGDSADEEEIQTLYENILDEYETEMGDTIANGDFAAVETSADEGYYVVRWTDTPAALEEYEEEAAVEGCDRSMLQEGTMVCKGIYYSQPGRARKWYVPPSEEDEYLFRVRHVVATGLVMEEPSDTLKFPIAQVKKADRDNILEMGPLRLAEASIESIKAAIATRDSLNFYETEVVELGDDGAEEENEAEDDDESEAEEDLD